ncbi:MAG: hypothetical protein SGI83_10525 [Bacteroidota bacterium]|nr:hypothetical protein [Bacteroidota bacterium]
MPTNLSLPSISTLKRLRLIVLLLLSPLFFFAQTLTGLWTGALSNDSTTVRKDQLFEIALTEYKGKVYGYSRSEFIVDDTLYYVVKRLKGTIEGDVCEVTDDEIISYNFRGKLDKGIKVTSIFRRNQNDSAWYLDGTWKTNATKKYYSVTGKVSLEEEKDLTASKIFPHLEELKLADDIAFYKDRQETAPIVKLVKPEKIKTEYSTKSKPGLANTDVSIAANKPNLERATTKPPPIPSSITPDDAATPSNSAVKEAAIASMNKPVTNLPTTDKRDIATGSVDLNPTSPVKTITENKTTGKEVTELKKPTGDLPKNNTVITTTDPVAITTSSSPKIIAGNTVSVEEPALLNKPATNLPKTDTKSIAKNKVDIIPLSSSKTVAENKTTAAAIPGKTSTDPVSVSGNKPVKTGTVAMSPDQQQQVVAKNDEGNQQQKQTETRTVVKPNNQPTSTSAKPVAETNKQDIVTKNTIPPTSLVTNNPVAENKDTKTGPAAISIIPEEKKPAVDIIAKAALVAGRKSEFSQIVTFKADSLELSLYDNGEIDGDTVSIYMNGEVILSKQGLKGSAIKKTIYITRDNEDFTLVLFAENLGKYPPNTGLLVVHDGEDVYNLRFSSDFQKNAGIVFRRKK